MRFFPGSERGLRALLCVGLAVLALFAAPVRAQCTNWATTATTPVLANGIATSAIRVTNSSSSALSVTVTITGSARFNNGTQTYTQNVNTSNPINITATNTVGETVTVRQTSTACTQSRSVVFRLAAPTVGISFSPSTFAINGTTTKTITLTNPNNAPITGVRFSDTHFSGGRNTSPAVTSNTCGGTLSASAGGNSWSLSGGTIPANGSCLATVVVRGTTTQSNRSDSTGTVSSTNANSGASVSATVTVQAISRDLSQVESAPASVPADGVTASTITVTIRDGAGNPISGRAVSITRSTTSGNTITTVSGSTNSAGQATFSVRGTTGQTVTYTASASSLTVIDTAQVVFAPVQSISKSFSPAAVAANGTSTLSIVLSNNGASILSGQSFTDTYPGGLVNATPLQTTNSCGGTLTATAGGGSIALSGASVPAKPPSESFGTCTVTVVVRPTAAGSYPNTVTGSAGSASATLSAVAISVANSTVVSSPASIPADGSTTATITVTLRDGASPSGNVVAGKQVQLTAATGNSQITTLSGTTDASGVATFAVSNTLAEGPIVYSALDVTDNVPLTDTAEVTFTPLTAPTVTKSFSPATIGDDGTSTMTVTLSNPNGAPIYGVAFQDDYPVIGGLANATPLVLSNSCGGVNALTEEGGTTLDLEDGTIPASGSCSVSVAVTASGAVGNIVNSTGVVTSGNANDGASASGTLRNLPIDPALSTVVASPTSIEANGTSTSTITVTLVDGAGVGVINRAVTLSAGSGSSVISGPTSSNGNLTDANGQLTFTVRNAVAQTVTYTARDTLASQNITQTATVVFAEPQSRVTAISCVTACTQTAITTTVQWNVTFDRSVTGVTAAAFSLVPTGLTGSAITAVTGSGTSWTVTANVGTGAGTLGLNQTGAGTVSPTLTGTFTGQVYTTPATVVTAITCATACAQTTVTPTVQWNVTFNRSVTGVDASAFALVATGLTGSSITTVTGSGTSWVVTANVGTGAGTLGLNQTGAGTVSPVLTGTFTGQVYTTTATVVSAIDCATACIQTAVTPTVSWTVTFNRSVTNVTAAAFSLVATGITGASITSVTGSGTSWTVTADVGSGAGTLGLNQTGAGTVSPTLTGTFTGQVYTTPATVVTAITCATACIQTAITATVQWNVTFNRSVTGVTSAAFGLVANGLSGAAITAVTGSGTGWVVTASVGSGAGTLGLNQTGAGTVSPTLTGTFTGEVYTTPSTVVTAISCASSCTQAISSSTVSWTVSFNRSVTGVGASVFTLASTGLTGAFIAGVSGSGTTWTVTANLGVGTGTLRLDQSSAGSVSPVLTGTFTGETYTLLTAPTLAIYRFDEIGWTGSAGEVQDSSGNGYHAQAVNGATTATTAPLPAISTNPGTCRYGIMSGGTVTNGYVSTPLPNLTTDFTVAGWIRSTNVASQGQRILADDNSSTGYGFSLGEAGPGRLRFFNRGLSTVIFDSTYALSNDVWYFVAAVADVARGQRSIYVFDASGNLLSGQTSAVATGTWQAGPNAAQIGYSNQSNYFKGYIDELQIYPRVLSQAAIASLVSQTHTCPVISGPDHFQLSHGGSGVTCTATPVALSAHNVDHTILTGYTGTATLSSSAGRGDWTLVSGNGVLSNGAANDGAASYAFAAGDNGSVTLGFQDTTAGTVSLGAVDGAVTETSGAATTGTDDPSLTFATSGFEFRADGVANAIGTQIAGKPSGTAPGAQTLQIRAIRTSDSSTVCEAALQGAQTVQMAYECVSPASCSAATLAVGATTIAGNPSGSVGSYSNTTLSFDNAGLATLAFTWNDAGSARLHARYALPVAGGGASGNFMAGSSNTFVSRPFAFALTVSANPAASSAAGAAFTSAGTAFGASARAVAWSAAADANADGIADGMESADTSATNNADLSANASTPNYAPSTALTLGSTLQFPAGGTHPGLTGSPSAVFTNGVAAITGLRYDEVGIIEITAAQGGSYLGIGSTETAKIRGSSGFVGRFRPARLAVVANVPLLASACSAGAFSYIGQPVYFGTAPVLSVTAQSALGTTTTNYTQSGFFKLDTTLTGRSYADGSGAHPLGYTAAGSVTLGGSTAGSGTATLTLASDDAGDAITWTRATPEGPFMADVDAEFTAASLTDGDGACHDPDANGSCDSFTISGIEGTQLRYGRLVAQSALGSEMQSLLVPVTAQYHDGSGFALNSADSCTTLSTAALDFGVGSYSGAPAAGVLTFPIGAGSSTASMPATTLSGGRLNLRLSAPGAGNVGEIDYLINLGTLGSSWLQYDWDGSGNATANPRGRASFGVYSGPSRVVYRRESW